MMSDLQDLYQELIIDHNKRPRNRRKLDQPDHHCDGYNPLCGDRVSVFVKMDGDVLQDVTFEGSGCAISTASASLMTESVKGKTVAQARALFDKFRSMVTEQPADGDPSAGLGKLEVFAGVRNYPARVKCAILVWHTLQAAMQDNPHTVSTES